MAVASVHAEHTAARGSLGALHPVPVAALGCSLSLFFAFSFVLCVLGYLAERAFGWQLQIAHGFLSVMLPGFAFGSWPRFFLGLAESLAWGWYIALVLGPLYNFFAARVQRGD
jgi:hypothetical protein